LEQTTRSGFFIMKMIIWKKLRKWILNIQ